MSDHYEYRLALRLRLSILRHLFGVWSATCARYGVSRLHPLALLVYLEVVLVVARFRLHVAS